MLFPRTKARKPHFLIVKAYLVFSSYISHGEAIEFLILRHRKITASDAGVSPKSLGSETAHSSLAIIILLLSDCEK